MATRRGHVYGKTLNNHRATRGLWLQLFKVQARHEKSVHEPESNNTSGHAGLPAAKALLFIKFRELRPSE